jgi:protein phosphatase
LHGVVDAALIREILASDLALESKCHALIDAARKAGGPDNITAVLLSVV